MYIPFGEKSLVLKFELPRISIMPGKITLYFYLRGLLYKGGPKNLISLQFYIVLHKSNCYVKFMQTKLL